MLFRFKQQLSAVRQQPDYVRADFATRWIIIFSVLLGIVLLLLILPLQIYVNHWRNSSSGIPVEDKAGTVSAPSPLLPSIAE